MMIEQGKPRAPSKTFRYVALGILCGQALAVLVAAYYLAYDDVSAGWQAFHAVQIYVSILLELCVIGLVVSLALFRQPAQRGIATVLAVTSCVLLLPPGAAMVASMVKPMLYPVATFVEQRDRSQREAAYEGEKRADYEALLREFQAPQQVLAVLLDARAPMLILEGRKVVKLYRQGYYMPKEEEAEVEQYLNAEVVGKDVIVQLAPREYFLDVYIPEARGGYSVAAVQAMGGLPRYGMIPAMVFLGTEPLHERVVSKTVRTY